MDNQSKVFKILSLDGGGIKGLFGATILADVEKRKNKPISDMFDLICGTSTGGILALAIAMKVPMEDVCKFYQEHGPSIFSEDDKKHFLKKYLYRINNWPSYRMLCKPKYQGDRLQNALISVFGSRKIGESNNLLCIPSFNITQWSPCVFKYDHTLPLTRDNNKSCVEIAMATAAAPTYFGTVTIGTDQHIDGGVWANNPTLCGILEAYDYFVGDNKEYQELSVLSIGCLSAPKGENADANQSRGFFNWGAKLFDAYSDGQSSFTDLFIKKLSPHWNINYQRIDYSKQSKEHINCLSMDNASISSLKLLKSCGLDVANNIKMIPEIEHFFNTTKTQTINSYGQ